MRVHVQYNWLVHNSFIIAANLICQAFDILLDLIHVEELLPWYFFRENCPWFCLLVQMV